MTVTAPGAALQRQGHPRGHQGPGPQFAQLQMGLQVWVVTVFTVGILDLECKSPVAGAGRAGSGFGGGQGQGSMLMKGRKASP